MKREEPGDLGAYTRAASPFVRKFASRIASASPDKRIADVACGSGRNAIVLAQLGCSVVCVDQDLTGLKAQRRILRGALRRTLRRLTLLQVDLVKDPWPFSDCALGGIINVHFLLPALFPFFEKSLSAGGYLLLETVPGCGGNYLELPKAGALRSAFEAAFSIEAYNERKVGPCGYQAVTVHMLAKRKG
jgi:SAM-dependent methyltransferase